MPLDNDKGRQKPQTDDPEVIFNKEHNFFKLGCLTFYY